MMWNNFPVVKAYFAIIYIKKVSLSQSNTLSYKIIINRCLLFCSRMAKITYICDICKNAKNKKVQINNIANFLLLLLLEQHGWEVSPFTKIGAYNSLLPWTFWWRHYCFQWILGIIFFSFNLLFCSPKRYKAYSNPPSRKFSLAVNDCIWVVII